MAKFPTKPPRGSNALQSFYTSICEIIDFLPSLTLHGDNKTIKISEYAFGKTISAIPPVSKGGGGPTTQVSGGSILAKTVENSTGPNIKVKLYPNGDDSGSTYTVYNLFIPNISLFRKYSSKHLDYGKPCKFTCIWW